MRHDHHCGYDQQHAEPKRDPQRFAEVRELDRQPDHTGHQNDRDQNCVHGTDYTSATEALS